MKLNQLWYYHTMTSIQAGNHVVQGTKGNHGQPAQSARVYVPYSPISVVRQGIYRTNGHHRAFKSGHPVERQGDHQELEDGVRARSEEHTSELQSRGHLVCRLLL